MAYPEWVEKHRKEGTNISCIRGKYYLYACKSVYDKEKKKSKKITTEYLGRITEQGFIPRKEKEDKIKSVSVKEYGASETIFTLGRHIYDNLKEHFPNEASTLFALALIRLIEKCPFKRVASAYINSYLSEILGNIPLSSATISNFLKEFGKKREDIVKFLKTYIGSSEYILFDGTNIVSNSNKMDINRIGYNSHNRFEPQINLMMAFSSDKQLPCYYRILPGNIRDITSFKKSVIESGIQNMTVIADKGFGSKSNFELLDEMNLKYIVPLKRNNDLIDRAVLKTGDKKDFDGVFRYKGRVIWYYSYLKEGKSIYVYLDSDLRNEEEKDYAKRIEEQIEGYTMEGLLEKQYKFGTIALCSNIEEKPERIYSLYKTRGEIETSFDFLKNLLDQDKIYLQNDYAVETWAFINHISLMLVYCVYNKLRETDLLKKYSITDFIEYMKYIKKVKINGKWYTSEVSKKTKDLIKPLGFSIT